MGASMDNPWERDRWNVTAQGAFTVKHGETLARAYAADAGVAWGATKPAARDPAKIEHHTRIVNKTNVTNVIGNRGYSGDGPPGENM